MKRFKLPFIALAAALMFTACGENNEVKKETVEVSGTSVNGYDTLKTEALFVEFVSLYKELMAFRKSDDYIKYGLGLGGPYRDWLDRVKKLEDNPNANLLVHKDVVAGQLHSLAMAYVNTRGEEDNVTKGFNSSIIASINAVHVEDIVYAKGDTAYNNIREGGVLIGRYEVSGTSDNGLIVELYNVNGEYTSVEHWETIKLIPLRKEGNKYYERGNKRGEGFRLDTKKNMVLFDREGDLTDFGIISKLIK